MSLARPRVAVVGGGIAGVTAAWQLTRSGADVTLFEASNRLGATVETIRRDGFIIESGPDGWVTEKPWAEQLARELGLEAELSESLDAGRVTYILQANKLVAMPDGMSMMVPTDLTKLAACALFSAEAVAAYAAEPGRAAELRAMAPDEDESVATFVARHFGEEVLRKIGAPLLSGVFGGDVALLSMRSVMPAFVQMERDHGSLILALQSKLAQPKRPIFTTLRTGVATLIDRMHSQLDPGSIRLNTPVQSITRSVSGWHIHTSAGQQQFDSLLLCVPARTAIPLLTPHIPQAAQLLSMDATSAVIAALAFGEDFALPSGFGFLVPAGEQSPLLASTFVDQKFSARTPPDKRLIRAFYGGQQAHSMRSIADTTIAQRALEDLTAILGPLPQPDFHVVRHWPQSLPQYAVGHVERVAALQSLVDAIPALFLLGNAYRGVGLPDLIRDARALAIRCLS